jgi:hypothetical protein
VLMRRRCAPEIDCRLRLPSAFSTQKRLSGKFDAHIRESEIVSVKIGVVTAIGLGIMCALDTVVRQPRSRSR